MKLFLNQCGADLISEDNRIIDFSCADMILVRGVSGSGKSALAGKIAMMINLMEETPLRGNAYVYSADSFFERAGEYKFNPRQLGQAHQSCLDGVSLCLDADCLPIVANTMTRQAEVQPYLDLLSSSRSAGYRNLFVIDMLTQYGNVHGVPDETVNRQKLRFVPCDKLKYPENLNVIAIQVTS